MTRFRRLAWIMIVVFALQLCAQGGGVCAKAALDIRAPRWSQDNVDNAVGTHVVAIRYQDGVGIGVYQATAMYMLALMSYFDTDLTSSDGTKVSDRLLEHIRSVSSPGNEPTARGFLSGWVDGPVAQALTLARHTPKVWNALNDDERARVDFIMQVLAVVGNYTQNYYNNPSTDLSQSGLAYKTYNPNFQEGYVGIMIAAYLYFGGAEKVNSILADFSYDEYIKQMDAYGFRNMKYFFEKTGKTLLESGGTDANGGTLKGARIPFCFQSASGAKVEYDPLAIYDVLAQRMYSKEVVSEVYDKDGNLCGYIADGSKSPFEGMQGMAHEFSSVDAGGIRTDATYVMSGWVNSIPTRATLEALGVWDSERMRDADSRMYVGSEDFIYKVSPEHGGYAGYQKGHTTTPTIENQLGGWGFFFMKDIWNKLLKKDYQLNAGLLTEDSQTTLKCEFESRSPYDLKAKLVVAIYQNDSLTYIKATPCTIQGLGKSQAEVSVNMAADMVKTYLWDPVKGMQPLSITASDGQTDD